MMTFSKWRTGRIFDLDTQNNFLIIIKTIYYNNNFTCSIYLTRHFTQIYNLYINDLQCKIGITASIKYKGPFPGLGI